MPTSSPGGRPRPNKAQRHRHQNGGGGPVRSFRSFLAENGLLEMDEEVYSLRRPLHFPDRLVEVQVVFHIRDCLFPAPGPYEAILLVDGDWVARRKFSVGQREEQP